MALLRIRTALVFLLLGCALTPDARALLIDSFDVTQTLVANAGTPQATGFVSGAGILGAERDAVVDYLSGPGDATLAINPISNGQLSFSLDAFTGGSTLLVWDGVDSAPLAHDPSGLGGVDLTDGGLQLGIEIRVTFDDLPVDLVFDVSSDAGNASQATLALPGGIFSSPEDFFLPFSSFSPTAGSGADFANVGLVSLSIQNASPGTDLLIDLIGTVNPIPEPGTGALLALGLGLLGANARKRRGSS